MWQTPHHHRPLQAFKMEMVLFCDFNCIRVVQPYNMISIMQRAVIVYWTAGARNTMCLSLLSHSRQTIVLMA